VNLGNILGTHYELKKHRGNTLGNRENWKKKSSLFPPNLKGIKVRHIGPSYWPPPAPRPPQIEFAWWVQCRVFKWTLYSPLSAPNPAWKKKPPLQPPTINPKLKRKKTNAPWEHDCTSHWLDEISLVKRIHHNFSPGLLHHAMNNPGI
jgi:hypothetical protein